MPAAGFTRESCLAKLDPRQAPGGMHDEVVKRFQIQRSRVSLRRFSWEPQAKHTYRDIEHA